MSTQEHGTVARGIRLGIVFTADRLPEELPAFAVAAEAAGYDELWVWEDCFYGGGISASAVALAATRSIRVGLGIMPAVFRNPVATAMEAATLARVFPGRFIAGLGHGQPGWMRQIGALPPKPVRALEETTIAVRRLLHGERFSMHGEHVHLDDVALVQAPAEPPPVVLGVRAPRGLEASGRSADGTVLAEPAPASYVRWARERIDCGRQEAGRVDPHPLTAFLKCRVDPDLAVARLVAAETLGNASIGAHLAPLGRDAEIAALQALGAPDRIAAAMPDDLVRELVVCGDAAEVAASLSATCAAGLDAIGVVPVGPDPNGVLARFAGEVLPLLRG